MSYLWRGRQGSASIRQSGRRVRTLPRPEFGLINLPVACTILHPNFRPEQCLTDVVNLQGWLSETELVRFYRSASFKKLPGFLLKVTLIRNENVLYN